MTEPQTEAGKRMLNIPAIRNSYSTAAWVEEICGVEAEATAAAEQRLAGLREALRTLSDVGWVLARITPEGERIAPPDDAWHDLDEALEQARALLDTPPSASPRQGEPQATLASDPATTSEPAIVLRQGELVDGLDGALASLHNGIRQAGMLGLDDVTVTAEAAIAIRDAFVAARLSEGGVG